MQVKPVLQEQSACRLASRRQRVFTLLWDLLFCYIFLQILYTLFFLFSLNGQLLRQYPIVSYLIALFLYYLIQESIWNTTIAKSVMGTRVVTVSGDSPGFMQILFRTALRFIPIDFLSFLGNPVKRNEHAQASPVGWHDRYSNTRVIDIRTI